LRNRRERVANHLLELGVSGRRRRPLVVRSHVTLRARLASPASAAPADATTAIAIPTAFVVTHVRHALQQTVAVGAASPYLPAS
jgi:hypothetical protein